MFEKVEITRKSILLGPSQSPQRDLWLMDEMGIEDGVFRIHCLTTQNPTLLVWLEFLLLFAKKRSSIGCVNIPLGFNRDYLQLLYLQLGIPGS